MDMKTAAAIFAEGVVVEENDEEHRIWPNTITGQWLYPGEKVVEYDGRRYVVTFPEEAELRLPPTYHRDR